MTPEERLLSVLSGPGRLEWKRPNLAATELPVATEAQEKTVGAFSNKWTMVAPGTPDFYALLAEQKRWYLQKYGFKTEDAFAAYLRRCRVILDAGTGNAMKAAWFAELSPDTTVVAADISDAVAEAAEYYSSRANMVFVRCDIGAMPFFASGGFDFVNCDEVIHHTASPETTFRELVRLAAAGRAMTCYVYRRKALPRELLDDHFRGSGRDIAHGQMRDLAVQLTELGRLLGGIKEELDFPAIPALDIEGGRMTVQRFVYWNFLKCYWNDAVGYNNSVVVNYDWYSPAIAFRYREAEFRAWIGDAGLEVEHFHAEPACYCARLRKPA